MLQSRRVDRAFNFIDLDDLIEQLLAAKTWDGIIWPAAVVVDTEGDSCSVILVHPGHPARTEMIG